MFRDVAVQDLASTVIRAVLDRTRLRDDAVDVVLGQRYPNGEAPGLGLGLAGRCPRRAALDAEADRVQPLTCCVLV